VLGGGSSTPRFSCSSEREPSLRLAGELLVMPIGRTTDVKQRILLSIWLPAVVWVLVGIGQASAQRSFWVAASGGFSTLNISEFKPETSVFALGPIYELTEIDSGYSSGVGVGVLASDALSLGAEYSHIFASGTHRTRGIEYELPADIFSMVATWTPVQVGIVRVGPRVSVGLLHVRGTAGAPEIDIEGNAIAIQAGLTLSVPVSAYAFELSVGQRFGKVTDVEFGGSDAPDAVADSELDYSGTEIALRAVYSFQL
jgi:hypothetical protein